MTPGMKMHPLQAHLWLAQLLCGSREIQDVIYNLKGQAQVPPILKHGVLDLQKCQRLILPAAVTQAPGARLDRHVAISCI